MERQLSCTLDALKRATRSDAFTAEN